MVHPQFVDEVRAFERTNNAQNRHNIFVSISQSPELRNSVEIAKLVIPLVPEACSLFRISVLKDFEVALLVVRFNPSGAALPVSVLADSTFIETIFQDFPKWAKFIPKCEGLHQAFKGDALIEKVMRNIQAERCQVNVLRHVPALKPCMYATKKLREFNNFKMLLHSCRVFAKFPTELQVLVGEMVGYSKSKKWRQTLTKISAFSY